MLAPGGKPTWSVGREKYDRSIIVTLHYIIMPFWSIWLSLSQGIMSKYCSSERKPEGKQWISLFRWDLKWGLHFNLSNVAHHFGFRPRWETRICEWDDMFGFILWFHENVLFSFRLPCLFLLFAALNFFLCFHYIVKKEERRLHNVHT